MTTVRPHATAAQALADELLKGIGEADRRKADLGPHFVSKVLRDAYPQEFATTAIREMWYGAELSEQTRADLATDKDLRIELTREVHRRRAREIAAEMFDAPADDRPWNDGLASTMCAEPVAWRCDGLLTQNARLLVQAQYKAGKTTFLLNLARFLLQGDFFLGRFETTPLDPKNVGYLNYEVSEAQFVAWAKAVGVPLTRMYVNNLRGMPNPFVTDRGVERLAERLIDHDVRVLIVDPYARAFPGDDLDRTGPAVAFTNALDKLAEDANLSEIALANHAGHDATRGRNSTVLNDWADTIVTLTRDKDTDQRFIKAIGRDVDLAEDRLDFDPETHLLTLSGTGSRRSNARQDKIATLAEHAAKAVRCAPKGGTITGSLIEEYFHNLDLKFTKGDGNKAAKAAHNLGVRCVRDEGDHRPKHWGYEEPNGADDEPF